MTSIRRHRAKRLVPARWRPWLIIAVLMALVVVVAVVLIVREPPDPGMLLL